MATYHLELIPWLCSLIAKLTPRKIRAAHTTWHSDMCQDSVGASLHNASKEIAVWMAVDYQIRIHLFTF